MFNQRKESRRLVGLGLGDAVDRCRQKREELDRIRGGTFRGVSVVVRRELNLAKPINLLAGLLILAIGFGIGWWFRDPPADSFLPVAQAKLGPPESESHAGSVIKLEPAANGSVAPAGIGQVQQQSSSGDTLSQKINDLLERVKRGE